MNIMKKITLFLTLASLFLLAGCNQETEYIINGVAGDYPDGTMVYLQMRDKPEWISVDSAKIVKGRFLMKGHVAPGFLGYIGVGEERTLIVVEHGEIVIDLKDGNPHGTESKERLSTFSHDMENIEEQMADIFARMDSLDQNDTVTYGKFMARLEELDHAEMNLMAKTIEENIDNPLGVGMFCFYNSVFADNVDFLRNISEQIPEEYLQQRYVTKVLENVNTILRTSAGNHFTDLKMTTREGKEISLESLVNANKYVLIDFWASWCAPCRQSLPGIRKLYDDYVDRGLCIVGISLDDDKSSWENALVTFRMDWVQVSELRGWESEYAAAYGVRAIPATVLIDSTGTIVGRNLESADIARIIENEGIGE